MKRSSNLSLREERGRKRQKHETEQELPVAIQEENRFIHPLTIKDWEVTRKLHNISLSDLFSDSSLFWTYSLCESRPISMSPFLVDLSIMFINFSYYLKKQNLYYGSFGNPDSVVFFRGSPKLKRLNNFHARCGDADAGLRVDLIGISNLLAEIARRTIGFCKCPLEVRNLIMFIAYIPDDRIDMILQHPSLLSSYERKSAFVHDFDYMQAKGFAGYVNYFGEKGRSNYSEWLETLTKKAPYLFTVRDLNTVSGICSQRQRNPTLLLLAYFCLNKCVHTAFNFKFNISLDNVIHTILYWCPRFFVEFFMFRNQLSGLEANYN